MVSQNKLINYILIAISKKKQKKNKQSQQNMDRMIKYLILALFLFIFVSISMGQEDPDYEEDDEPGQPKPKHKINTRPIIGILSQQSKPEFEPNINMSTSYIAASYVKWIEAAGGQSVPILNTYSKSHVLKIMSRINGVLLPGGFMYYMSTIKQMCQPTGKGYL